MSNKLTCLILSDLHTLYGKKHEDESFLTYVDGKSDFEDQLMDFLTTRLNRPVDCLICPGDIGNRADRKTFELGWHLLQQIKSNLAIPQLHCVPGNHDYDSKRTESIDPRSYLKYLTPFFPTHIRDLNTQFWAWNWCASSTEKYNAIIIDTSAFQGYSKIEFAHGRIIPQTADHIIKYVSSEDFYKKPINLMIFHHNPYQICRDDVGGSDDFAVGAEYLLSRLTSCAKGPWFIIHGHKHVPAIKYASSGSSESPVVFSAGTLAAKFRDDYQPYAANQLYLVEIDLDLSSQYGRAMGVFETFEFFVGKGWIPAKTNLFPRVGGFGSDLTPSKVLFEIKKLLEQKKIIRNEDIIPIKTMLKYLPPDDIKKIRALLLQEKITMIENQDEIEEIYGESE